MIWRSREVPLRNHLNRDQKAQEPVRQKGRRVSYRAGRACAEALRPEGACGVPGSEATSVAGGKLEPDKEHVRWDHEAVPWSSGLSQGSRGRKGGVSGL